MASCCADYQHNGITKTTSAVTLANRWDHVLARWGIKRSKHRIEPGLYSLGNPDSGSPVFVTANYTLSFDALRSALDGLDAYIMVLDTKGINVWCAAGKGTFGTDEVVHRAEASDLYNVVSHRRLILPQLGAPGVAAHEVKKRTGFKVDYGPVRATDIPEYMKTGKATPEMRRVRFGLLERLTLIPVEFVSALLPMLIAAALLFFVGGPVASAAAVVSVLASVVAFPILLPWLPTEHFSSKGFIIGVLAALPFAAAALLSSPATNPVVSAGWALAYLLAMPPVTAFFALNFTGATTFTSKTGVKREIFKFLPLMTISLACGLLLALALRIAGLLGLAL